MVDTAPLVALSFEFPGEMDPTLSSTRKPIIRQLEQPPRGARPRQDSGGLRDKPPSTRASPTPKRKTAPAPLDLQDGSTSSSRSGSPVGPRTAPVTRSKPLPPTVSALNTSPGRRPLPQISTRPPTTKNTSVRPLPSVPASSPDTSPVLRYPPPPYSVFSSATMLDGVRPLPRPPGPVERRQLPPPPFSAMPALHYSRSQDSTQQTTPKKNPPSIKLDVAPNTLRRLTNSGGSIFGDIIRHLKGEEVSEGAFCEGILARMNSNSCTPPTPCSFAPSAMSKGEPLLGAMSECGYAESFRLDPGKEVLDWDESSPSTPSSHSKFALSFRLDDEFYGDDSCPSTPDSITPLKRNTILSIANNCGESVSFQLDFEQDDEDKEDNVAWDWLIKDGVMSPSIVQRQPLRFSKRWFREKNGGLVEEKDYCTVLNFLRSL